VHDACPPDHDLPQLIRCLLAGALPNWAIAWLVDVAVQHCTRVALRHESNVT
jgi:hypothetical protein